MKEIISTFADELILEVVLKPCPWCQKTPDIYMPIQEKTWCWRIRCMNLLCKMQPNSPHVAIRNTAKTTFVFFFEKLCILANKWNEGNPFKSYEMKIINLERLAVNEGWKKVDQDIFYKRIHEGR